MCSSLWRPGEGARKEGNANTCNGVREAVSEDVYSHEMPRTDEFAGAGSDCVLGEPGKGGKGLTMDMSFLPPLFFLQKRKRSKPDGCTT